MRSIVALLKHVAMRLSSLDSTPSRALSKADRDLAHWTLYR